MIIEQLLLEATDLLNVDNLIKAFERGQISGLSYKKLLDSHNKRNEDDSKFINSTEEEKEEFFKKNIESLGWFYFG